MKDSPLPIIDLSPLYEKGADLSLLANQIRAACQTQGFFYVTSHGVLESMQRDLEDLTHLFFTLPTSKKLEISMDKGARAWRGYFPVGGELTSGIPDLKEGLYFGQELPSHDHRVQKGLALHGANLFPKEIPQLRETISDYIKAMTELGHTIMEGIALSLNLERDYFPKHFTTDPLILFRMFHYPANHQSTGSRWGVGEHTDYGLLTILKQDNTGGLEVHTDQGWLEAPPIPNTFLCNLGDMLERLTQGVYRSTPHRVHNRSTKSRFSWPFFFDPNFHAEIKTIELSSDYKVKAEKTRWDLSDPRTFCGPYHEYLLAKLGKVFPDLKKNVLP